MTERQLIKLSTVQDVHATVADYNWHIGALERVRRAIGSEEDIQCTIDGWGPILEGDSGPADFDAWEEFQTELRLACARYLAQAIGRLKDDLIEEGVDPES